MRLGYQEIRQLSPVGSPFHVSRRRKPPVEGTTGPSSICRRLRPGSPPHVSVSRGRQKRVGVPAWHPLEPPRHHLVTLPTEACWWEVKKPAISACFCSRTLSVRTAGNSRSFPGTCSGARSQPGRWRSNTGCAVFSGSSRSRGQCPGGCGRSRAIRRAATGPVRRPAS